MARNVFQIENGKLWLTPVGPSDDSAWIAPGGKTVETVTEADYLTTTGVDASCQVQAGAVTATPQANDQTVDATFCEAAETIPQPGATSFSLDVTALQDPNVVGGVAQFLDEHDTELIYWMLGLDGTNPPKAIGKARAIAGTFGGPARTTLTFDVSLPVVGRPQRLYGTAAASVAVPSSEEISGPSRSSASPGDVFPADPDITASDATNAAKLATETPPFIASPTTVWSLGEEILIGPYAFHWSGTAWSAGAAP